MDIVKTIKEQISPVVELMIRFRKPETPWFKDDLGASIQIDVDKTFMYELLQQDSSAQILSVEDDESNVEITIDWEEAITLDCIKLLKIKAEIAYIRSLRVWRDGHAAERIF